jgi:hypothetical protein
MAAQLAASQEGPSFAISVISSALLIALGYPGLKNNLKKYVLLLFLNFDFCPTIQGRETCVPQPPLGPMLLNEGLNYP